MGNSDSTNSGGTLARLSSTLTDGANSLVKAFADKATPEDMLRLAQLVKETREMERRAEAGKETIAANRELAMKAMELRETVLTKVVDRRMDRTDRALDHLVTKLETAKTPAEISAVAQAISTVASSDHFSDVAELVAGIKSDKVELEF